MLVLLFRFVVCLQVFLYSTVPVRFVAYAAELVIHRKNRALCDENDFSTKRIIHIYYMYVCMYTVYINALTRVTGDRDDLELGILQR